MVRMLTIAMAALFLVPALVVGAEDVVWSVPTVDPLRWTSGSLDPSESRVPTPGQWTWSSTTGYFNVFRGSKHAQTLHLDLGLDGQAVSSEEFRALEEMHPDEHLFRIDVEGWRTDMQASRGFGRGYGMNLRLSSIDIGSPHWDGLSAGVHSALGIDQNDRYVFPRGQTLIYLRTPERMIERRTELDGTGIGDAGLSFSGPLGRWARGEHRWVASLDLPTGEENTLTGSGGWDSGIRTFSRWSAGKGSVRLGLGYTWLDESGSWLGVQRNDTWHVYVEYAVPLTRRFAFRIASRTDESPLADFTSTRVGRQSWLFYVGGRLEVGSDSWLTFDFGEDHPDYGLAPDFSLHFQLGTRFGRKSTGLMAQN